MQLKVSFALKSLLSVLIRILAKFASLCFIRWLICYASHLISSHLISSHLISSHLVSSRLVSSRLVSSHLISSHLISSHLISSHLISSHLISSHLISSHLILSYLILSYLILSYLILSYLILSYCLCTNMNIIKYRKRTDKKRFAARSSVFAAYFSIPCHYLRWSGLYLDILVLLVCQICLPETKWLTQVKN